MTARKSRAKKIAQPLVAIDDAGVISVPTPEQIASALASIDTSMETAVTAGAVDHHSQLSSWSGADSEVVLDQMIVQDALETSLPQQPELTIDADALAQYAQGSTEIAADGVEGLVSYLETIEPVNNVLDPLLAISGGVDNLPVPAEIAGSADLPGWTEVSTSTEDQPKTLDQLVALQVAEAVDVTVFQIKAQVDGRHAFEEDKSKETGLSNIFSTLKKVQTQMVTKRVAAVLNACNVDPSFINRVLHDGSRYNVYALGKLSDIVYGVSGGAITNAINIAILKSMFTCQEKNIAFTKEIAKACCSKQFKIEGSVGAHLTRHTVSTSTAPTQASSTMQALATLGVVDVSGSSRSPVYTLTTSPMTSKIKELLAA